VVEGVGGAVGLGLGLSLQMSHRVPIAEGSTYPIMTWL